MLNIYNPNNHDGDKSAAVIKKGVANSSARVDFSKYQDPTKEFTSQELKWGFWYIRNKTILYKILVAILFVIDAGLVIFNFWHWGNYLLTWPEAQRVQASLATAINYTGINPHYSAQPVQAINTQIFSNREGNYIAAAELINPNNRFLANFDYYFVINGEKTLTQKSFLLPGEKRLAVSFGIKSAVGGVPTVVLENLQFKRISTHTIPDPASWQTYRLNFQVSDFVFLKSLAQEGANTDAIQFKLTNASPYNYLNPSFYVALLQNGQMVGILPLHLDYIKSLETKNIDLRSFSSGLSPTEIVLYPMINVYDENVYLSS